MKKNIKIKRMGDDDLVEEDLLKDRKKKPIKDKEPVPVKKMDDGDDDSEDEGMPAYGATM
jgi:hypothetical protein